MILVKRGAIKLEFLFLRNLKFWIFFLSLTLSKKILGLTYLFWTNIR